MRRGKEYYAKHYKDAVKLYSEGVSIREIASTLDTSYSAVYHWVKGLRKPGAGNVASFVQHLERYGPLPAAGIKEAFPKHNELFLTAVRRGLPVKRHMLKKKYGEYSTWYYIEGQEKDLDARISELMDKVKEIRQKLHCQLKGD